MGKMVVSRRPDSTGKLRNTELLMVSMNDQTGTILATKANACSWNDFLFHLGPVTPRTVLYQADRDLRRQGTAAFSVDDGVVDEAWLKSFLLVPE